MDPWAQVGPQKKKKKAPSSPPKPLSPPSKGPSPSGYSSPPSGAGAARQQVVRGPAPEAKGQDKRDASPPKAQPSAAVRREWAKEQNALFTQLIPEDRGDLLERSSFLRRRRVDAAAAPAAPLLVGGVDLSFVAETRAPPAKGADAVAVLVVMRFEHGKAPAVVHESYLPVALDQPYIPGFLAFRESPPLEVLIKDLRARKPDLVPDVVMVDGNGRIHPRLLGLASHLGVRCGIPTLGVAKKLHVCRGLVDSDSEPIRLSDPPLSPRHCPRGLLGRYRALRGDEEELLGAVYRGRSPQRCKRSRFVSTGHLVTLPAVLSIVEATTRPQYSEPEPIRLADSRGRHILTLADLGMLEHLELGKVWAPGPDRFRSAPVFDDVDKGPCRGCSVAWTLEAGELEFAAAMRRQGKDFPDPNTCKDCRAKRRRGL
eukprot:Hpha_TRINITY_DN33705_c0_g1::TRINITY_DN33705_c0_g1_i1::g.25068::m.25068